ncbi:hypothetical protein BASA61_005776 [Batrachochytrium salamandrivorans]|nr:hypothetical protein BASA61_005776 [Batrachochytrium salamandrivorans]
MRVDIGIILSVLSFSALAKVIPNDDFHGSLLVRRAVSPDTTDLLWKRADGDDEQGSSPMDLDIGAEAEAGASNNAEAGASASSYDSSPDHPSGSGELSELDQTSDSAEELYRPSQKQLLIQRQGYMPRSDKRSIKAVVKKVTEAFEDEKVLIKETIEDITHLVSRIITNPRNVMKELKKIMRSITNMFRLTQVSYNSDYKMLLSEVKNPKNEACVKVTKAYIHQMESGRDLALLSLKRIKSMIDSGSMRPKETNPSEFSSSTLNVRDRQEVSSESSAEMLTESP